MRDKEARIEAAKGSVNKCRELVCKPVTAEFVILEFHNGFVVMPEDEFLKLPKAKQNKLKKW